MATRNQKVAALGAAPARPRRKRVKVKTGQIVAVPLRDGSFGLAHVAHYYGCAVTAHFAHREATPERLLDGLEGAMKDRLLTILDVTSDEIQDGRWPVIGHKEPMYPATMLDMKGTSYTGNMSKWFFDAYYGLVPWDGMHDPRYYEKMLLPGVPVPSTVRYKRDFERDAAAQAAAPANTAATQPAPEQAIIQGPGVIHIEIKYDGEGLPSMELLHRRQAIEEGLESAGVGTVTDAGGGGGLMDIYLETKDVAQAIPFMHAAIKAAGFEKDVRIEVEPTSDEDDSDDDSRDEDES